MLEGQLTHAVLLVALLAGVFVAQSLWQPAGSGAFAGLSTSVWFAIALAVPIVHQLFVVAAWRLQLDRTLRDPRRRERDGASKTTSAGFIAYLVVFFVLFAARMASVIALSISNAAAVDVSPAPRIIVAVLLAIPSFYLFYSVTRYFGFIRAAGADHFDARYRSMPLVRRGIFRYSRNSMYVYGLLALWIPGIIAAAPAAVLAAAFQHAYIWVHYYCTELPDMRRIYGSA